MVLFSCSYGQILWKGDGEARYKQSIVTWCGLTIEGHVHAMHATLRVHRCAVTTAYLVLCFTKCCTGSIAMWLHLEGSFHTVHLVVAVTLSLMLFQCLAHGQA